jgi:hypothetical protein
MATNFADLMTAERERLNKLIAEVGTKVQALNEEAAGYKRELAAIDAYERAKNGGTISGSRRGGNRAARGSRSETLLALIQGTPDGMTRSQILDAVGAKGNKSQEGSISNALTTMKKKGTLALQDGVYTAA